MAGLAAVGALTPSPLIGFAFAMGIGSALDEALWQALTAEAVPATALPAAVTLGGVSMNLARSLGPAVGGLVVGLAGPAVVFGLTALTFPGSSRRSHACALGWPWCRRPPSARCGPSERDSVMCATRGLFAPCGRGAGYEPRHPPLHRQPSMGCEREGGRAFRSAGRATTQSDCPQPDRPGPPPDPRVKAVMTASRLARARRLVGFRVAYKRTASGRSTDARDERGGLGAPQTGSSTSRPPAMPVFELEHSAWAACSAWFSTCKVSESDDKQNVGIFGWSA
jgi:hypothetical protein